VTTSWIFANYPGTDDPEKIRNFLIDKYREWGIDYVLIVGSRDRVPMRACFPNPFNQIDVSARVPTDYYYADLTGDWDADGNAHFGEYLQDDMDFYPDVYVGRLPCDDTKTIEAICNTTIVFEWDTGSWKHNVLQLGAVLFYHNYENAFGVWNRSDGATLMEQCRSDIFSPDGYATTCMYEEAGLRPSTYAYDMPLNRSNVLDEWTNGYGAVSMLGHASNTKITRLVWCQDDGDLIPEYPDELDYVTFLKLSNSNALSVETSLSCKPPVAISAIRPATWGGRSSRTARRSPSSTPPA
jgi:hypothetical protein